MELRHLRYFVAVASHGSFNRAAEILNITQPPLSRQVKDLEEHLGVALLVRGTNSLKLTEAGELFYEEAREVIARADDAVSRVRGETGKEVLRVGYAPSMTSGIMSAALARFQAVTPGVRIELADLSSREINEMAAAGRLDLVVSPGV
ncbi:MAG: LysR family transcriptional regulator, partial [Verrucomicrobiaceae bacterium]